MAVPVGVTGNGGPDYQQTFDEIMAMFPDVAAADVRQLMQQYQGDMMQIIDKLLQRETHSPSTQTGTTEAQIQKSSVQFGNQANLSSAAITSPASSDRPVSSGVYQSYTVDNSQQFTPWGPGDSFQRPTHSFPSAFAKPVPMTASSANPLDNSYGAPMQIGQSAVVTHTVPIQANQNFNDFEPRSPVSRSVSPPPISRSSPVSSVSSSSSAVHMPKTTPTSTNPSTSEINFGPSPHATNTQPMSSTPVKSIYSTEQMLIPSEFPRQEERTAPQSPETTNLISTPSMPLGSPNTGALPSYVHSNPRLIALSPPVTSPLGSTTGGSANYGSPTLSSPLGSALGQSKTTEDRLARMKATEAQFQALMASMSEMDTASQHELELKEARIVQLEAQLSALASEKSTWIGRLEKVSQTTVQLRDQVEQQSKMIEMLHDQLKARDDQIAQLQTKLLSYKPIEGADQFRAAFESSIQTAIPALDEQGSNGQVVLQQALADFAATFQRALAASLLAPLQPK